MTRYLPIDGPRPAPPCPRCDVVTLARDSETNDVECLNPSCGSIMTSSEYTDWVRTYEARSAARARLTWEEIEEIASEDPGDRQDRNAHGFTREDDWQDRSVLCRNGCGLSYLEVVSGKIRHCRAGKP